MFFYRARGKKLYPIVNIVDAYTYGMSIFEIIKKNYIYATNNSIREYCHNYAFFQYYSDTNVESFCYVLDHRILSICLSYDDIKLKIILGTLTPLGVEKIINHCDNKLFDVKNESFKKILFDYVSNDDILLYGFMKKMFLHACINEDVRFFENNFTNVKMLQRLVNTKNIIYCAYNESARDILSWMNNKIYINSRYMITLYECAIKLNNVAIIYYCQIHPDIRNKISNMVLS